MLTTLPCARSPHRALVDPADDRRAGELQFELFTEIHMYASLESAEVALFRVDPVVNSLLGYRKDFGYICTFSLA